MKLILVFLLFTNTLLFAENTVNEFRVKEKAQQYLKNQSVKFIENKGQMTDMNGKAVPFVLFKAEAPGVNLYITEKGLTYVLLKIEEPEQKHNTYSPPLGEQEGVIEWDRIDVALKGASIKKENIITEGESSYFKRYFLPHCPNGISDIHDYKKITIKHIYPNIDWVLYNSNDKGFKYDFIVHPGANANDIEMVYTSKKPIKINEQGELQINSKLGNIKENAPISFLNDQEIKTQFTQTKQTKIEIKGNKNHETSISFNFPNTDITHLTNDLIIDPQLTWATFYGGSGMEGPISITTDVNGNVFVAGYTQSIDLPTLNPGGGAYYQTGTDWDAFVLKFSVGGNLLWATYYAGSSTDVANSIKTDVNGNVFVAGYTYSNNFPTQNSGTFFQGALAINSDVFILKFDNLGNRLWATYYGGGNLDIANSLEIDVTGNIYVTGYTQSIDFPTQNSGTFFQVATGGNEDAFVLKFDNVGNRLWASYYGGSGLDMANSVTLDLTGNIYITGYTQSTDFPTQTTATFFQGTNGGMNDVFILKFDNLGNRLWATYFGGSTNDKANAILTDANGNIFVTGFTESTNFPTLNPGGSTYFQGIIGGDYDTFILKFSNTHTLLWSTYYGGLGKEGFGFVDDSDQSMAMDNCGNLWLCFTTQSNNIVTKQHCNGGFNDNSLTGIADQFITQFSNMGELYWATYFGGDGNDLRSPITIDVFNNLYVSGEWTYVNSETTYPLIQNNPAYYDGISNGADDGFIAKFITTISATTLTPTQTNPSTCSCNGIATISVSNTCSNLNYYWSNGTTILNTTITTSSVGGLCAGVHQVTVTSACSFTQIATFTLTGVGSSITPSITVTNASCPSSTGAVTLNSITGGTPNYTITEGASIIATNVNVPYTINAVSLGLHTYSLTDATGCSTTFTANISSSTFSVTASSLSSTLTCATSTVLLIASAATSYSWVGPGIFSGAATASTIVNSIGVYTVTATDASSCIAIATISVTQNTITPIITATNSSTLTCTTLTLSLLGTGGGTYNWTGSGIVSGASTANPIVNLPGVYNLTVTAPNGCKAVASTTVVQDTVTPYVAMGNCEPLTCVTKTIGIIGGSGTGTYTYMWSGPGIVSGATTTTPFVNLPGTYTLTVTDVSNGCSGIGTEYVPQDINPPTASVITLGTLSCVTTTTSLLGSGLAPGGVTYNWSGPGILSGASTATTIVNLPGIYNLTVTAVNGCTAVATTTVAQILSVPTLIVSSDVTITAGSQTQLIVTGNGTTYTWSSSVGLSCTTCTNPIANPVVTTTYCVLSSIGTCTAEACVLVTVKESCDGNKEYVVPNAFSPNGDTKNDEFCLQGWNGCVTSFNIKIYDRWGEKIYESAHENFCWDGTHKGKLLDPAVFVFYIQANVTNVGEITKKGNITLIK